VQAAIGSAAEVPLEVARRAAALLPAARELVETGNANAASDAVSASQMLHAAVGAALANVAINLASLENAARVASLDAEASRLRTETDTQLGGVDAAFQSRLRRDA
ncbi:MAG: cyclodeaminase/cyclohydrolase family protein, partial [Candidatus Dormiibacterota bacterium]